jgi:hypothetical protein
MSLLWHSIFVIQYSDPGEARYPYKSEAEQRISFAPEYFGVSNGVTEEEAVQAAQEFDVWLETCFRHRADEAGSYDEGPFTTYEEVLQGNKKDENITTNFITLGMGFADGSMLIVTLLKRERVFNEDDDELRGSPIAVWVTLNSPGIQARKLVYRIEDNNPPILRREEQNAFFTEYGVTIPPITYEQLIEQEAQGLNNQFCGLEELAGLMYLFDDEELPKTDGFFSHTLEIEEARNREGAN